MKNVVLENNDVIELIAKIYVDGSIRFVTKWKKTRLSDEQFYLTPNEVGRLKEHLN